MNGKQIFTPSVQLAFRRRPFSSCASSQANGGTRLLGTISVVDSRSFLLPADLVSAEQTSLYTSFSEVCERTPEGHFGRGLCLG